MYLPGKKNKCISFFIIGIMLFVTIAGAVLSAPVCVYALSLGGLKGTIASLIISLLLQTGVAPTNTTWLNQLNSAYGVESSIGTIEDMISNGLLTESGGQLIDTGLSQAIASEPAYSDLGIDDIFTTLSNETGVIAETGAVNLANQAINCGTLGTIGAFAGAVAVGVGVGVLANHVREYFGNIIKYGAPMTYQEMLSNLTYDGSFHYVSGRGATGLMTFTDNTNSDSIVGVKYISGNYIYFKTYETKTASTNINQKQYNNNNQLTSDYNFDLNVTNPPTQVTSHYLNSTINDNYVGVFQSQADALNYVNGIKNGTITPDPVFSPDLIGENGNQRYDTENDTFPNIGNIVPEGQDMRPVDMDDYQDYVDQANDNTEDGNVDESIQGQEFQDFVNPYFQPIPDEPLVPDNPVGPEQPIISPKPTPSPEEFDDVMVLTPTENIKDKFPFCIPFDIYDIVTGLSAEREAPVITCPVDLNGNTITVDLSEYDSVAELLRLLELILFIIGLAVATRSLIGASGGG